MAPRRVAAHRSLRGAGTRYRRRGGTLPATSSVPENGAVRVVWLAARAGMRRRVGATVALAMLVGLAGGVVLAAVAGASRTDTAMDRFLAYSRPDDLVVV